MPVSGNEEMVKPGVGQFSEYIAGIPIKKRRFPFILSSSQLTEDSPSLSSDNKSKKKGFTSPLPVSTVMNDATRSITSDIAESSKTIDINVHGVAASLNSGSVAANSNASGVAMSSTAGSVSASSNASSVAMSSTTGSVSASSNASGSVATSSTSGSVAASSNASSVAMSSASTSVVASLNAGSVASSSIASSVAMSSTSISVAASLNVGSVVESSNSLGVGMSSNAISVIACPIVSSAVEGFNVSSVDGSVSSFSDASEKSVLEKEKRSSDSVMQGNTSLLRVKCEEQSFPAQSRSLADINSKGKLVASGAPDNNLKLAKSELDLVGNESLTFNVGKDMFGSQLPTVSVNPGLSLGSLSAMASGNNEQGFRNQGKMEHVSLNLSLSKGEFSNQLRRTEVQPNNTEGADLLADRTNWDLNTTMDSWEGPADDDGASKMATHMDVTDIKPVICPAGTTPASMVTKQQVLEELQRRFKLNKSSSILTTQQCSTEDSLRLGLTTPYLSLNPYEKPSCSSAKVFSGKVVANMSSPWESVPGSKPSMANYKPIKSEPLDESVGSNSDGFKAKPIDLLNITQVKSEIIEKSVSESLKSSTPSTLNSVDARSLKSEPMCQSNKESPKRIEGPNHSDQQLLAVPTSTDSSLHDGVTTRAKDSMQDKDTKPAVEGQVVSNMISLAGQDVNEPNIAGEVDNSTSPSKRIKDPDPCTLKSMDVQLPDSRGLVEGSASDEKINLLGDVLEKDPYGVITRAEDSMQDKETKSAVEGQVVSNMISSAGQDVNEPNIAGEVDNSTSPSKRIKDSDPCTLKSMDVQLPDSRGLVEASASDEEKINLSDVLEEDSYGSDYESYDKQELATAMDIDHDRRAVDDFEDGEVREPVENTEIEIPICESQEAGNGNNTDTGFKDFVGFVGDNNPSSSSFREKETQREDPVITRNDDTNEHTNISVNKDSIVGSDKEDCMQGSSAVETPSNQFDEKGPIEAIPRTLVDPSERKDTVEVQEGELVSIRTSDMSQGTSETIGQGADDATNKTDSEGKFDSVLPKAEEFSNDDDAGKDVDNGGNRSRIINLSRASNSSSPGRTRSISGRTLQSQVGRERLPDVALEGDKFHPRGRDEAHADSTHRFSRERHHLQHSRNNRISFMRGRGRIPGRIDTIHGNQDSECNFASEFYNGLTEFRVARHKYASAVSDADLNFSSYNNGQGGAYFGTGRGGRKILNDDPSVLIQLPPRRRSPGGRDGPAGRGHQMTRRVPRNLSPSRCIGEDGSEEVGLRNMRGFANDHTDPMFSCCQPSFEGLDGPFGRGNREFSSVQRRGGLPRTRSKSPTRQQTRSHGPWSSLRRRSPDGFGGHMELPHRRSPPIYRVERIRSPDRPCFTGEMGIRRHGSPPYMSRPSNELRDLDPSRDDGHPRSGISNRNPSGRILLRNNRRLDLVDPRERIEGDEYFGGPMPSGRFHELETDGNADERRRYGDRRGPVRSFRSPYSVADNENFQLNAEGGPRSFRFCPEDDQEMHGRGNMREREFDRRIKNRPGNAPPRRTRNIEEQEGNFRHGGQVWHDDRFEDTSQQMKRKRF